MIVLLGSNDVVTLSTASDPFIFEWVFAVDLVSNDEVFVLLWSDLWTIATVNVFAYVYGRRTLSLCRMQCDLLSFLTLFVCSESLSWRRWKSWIDTESGSMQYLLLKRRANIL